MTRQNAIQTQQQASSASPLSRGGILQRKCESCGQHTIAGGECADCGKKKIGLQRKLTIGASNDPLELEADRIADRVMAMSPNSVVSSAPPSIQRLTGQTTGQVDMVAPDSVDRVLASSGKPLDPLLQQDMAHRFGHDFSRVRVHTGTVAEQSAQDVNASAYTVGHNIVFGLGGFTPGTHEGRRLLAHELTHVVQQGGADILADVSVVTQSPSVRASFITSSQIVSRADPQAVLVTMNLGRTPRTGLQFWPTNVTDTRVGPVSVQGGLLSGGASQLNVIIGENQTLRTLARQLLPLWITATPFTPPGAAAPLPLDIITEDDLAQGLLVYNQYYLPVPSMTNWRSGFRFPLPVEIDETTGIATLHPLQIRALASAFDPAWAPLLDRRASATTAPPAANLQADVTDFLARETTSLARGIHLSARALTNAVAELRFIRETFRQLGAAAFDVALAFMDNLVNREISLLAAQRDGAAILAEIRTALAAAPAVPTAVQQASLNRTNLMLGLVAGVAAVPPPTAARNRAEKSVTIDTVKLDGSTHNPATDVAVANGIFAQCNVRLVSGVNATATAAETITWLGGNTDLRGPASCGSPTAEERIMFQQATARFGLSARIRAFFPATVSGIGGAAGYSMPPYCATGTASSLRRMAVLSNTADTGDLAHEIGHILLNSGRHPAANLMNPFGPPQGERLTDAQCTTTYNNA